MRYHLMSPAPAVVLALLAAVACDAGDRAAPTAPAPDLSASGVLPGTLLISAGFDDFWGEIYTMRPDGSELTQLTDVPGAIDDGATWSPDGRRIAFHSTRAGTADIYVMDADGSNVVQLTSGPEQDAFPAWSPNGRHIAFGRDAPDPGFFPDLYVINADGTGLTQLTDSPAKERLPIWSPDGRRMLYHTGGGSLDIWVMNADGTGKAPFLATPQSEWASDWAPNGKILIGRRLATAPAFDIELFVMNDDATGMTQLTDLPGLPGNASWSWDMRRILFAYTPPGGTPGITDIWVMNADGSEPTPLTETPNQWEWNLDWRPRP